jgi:hypothetical protein
VGEAIFWLSAVLTVKWILGLHLTIPDLDPQLSRNSVAISGADPFLPCFLQVKVLIKKKLAACPFRYLLVAVQLLQEFCSKIHVQTIRWEG